MGYYYTTFFDISGLKTEIDRWCRWCRKADLKLVVLKNSPERRVYEATTKTFNCGAEVNRMPSEFPELLIDIVGHGPLDFGDPVVFAGQIDHGKIVDPRNGNAVNDRRVQRYLDPNDPKKIDEFWDKQLNPMMKLAQSV